MNDQRRRRCRRRQARSRTSAVCLWTCILASALSSIIADNESSQGKRHLVQQSSGMNDDTNSQVNGYSSSEFVSNTKTDENGEPLSPTYANVADSPSVVEASPPAAAPIIPKTTRNVVSAYCRLRPYKTSANREERRGNVTLKPGFGDMRRWRQNMSVY